MWSSADLAPLCLVPGHAAAKLAGIKIRIENTKTSLKKTGTGVPFPAGEIAPYCEGRRDDMVRELEDLDAPRQACKEFLGKHGIEI
jgi:hypothetical protein